MVELFLEEILKTVLGKSRMEELKWAANQTKWELLVFQK